MQEIKQMNNKEFRLGNWVKCDKLIGEVTQIQDREVLEVDEIGYTIEDCEPIPLTEEWLEKFGFNKTELANGNKFNVLINQSSGFSTYLIIYNKGSVSNPVFVFVLKTYNSNHVMTLPNIESYVHSLQNLYFALTGEELEYDRD